MFALMISVVVVDQVDGPAALVEIAEGDLREIDRRCLPAGAGEGDRIRVLLRSPEARCPVRGLWARPRKWSETEDDRGGA